MKDFEKRIIELCKTTNVEKILTITGIVLAIITLLGTFPRIINVLIALVVLAIIIIIRIVGKIKKTDIETFSKNNFWYVIFQIQMYVKRYALLQQCFLFTVFLEKSKLQQEVCFGILL